MSDIEIERLADDGAPVPAEAPAAPARKRAARPAAEAEAPATEAVAVPAPGPGPATPLPVVAPGPDGRDTVSYARLRYNGPAQRKSLAVHHLQRRLTELGYGEAGADRDGEYGALTEHAVSEWQRDHAHAETGLLLWDQAEQVFAGDDAVRLVD